MMEGTFNPKDYGAVWDGATNDTAAIQSAIDAAKAVGGTVWLPPGTGCFTAPLNVTNTLGAKCIKIAGAGSAWGGSILKAIALSGDYPHLLDCCGAKGIRLQDFVLSAADDINPMSGLFMVSGAGGHDLDMAYVENLYVSGKFRAGALYAAAHASSYYSGVKFYNTLNGGQPAVFLSAANGWNIHSNFVQTAADVGVSDLTFVACKIHDMSGNQDSYATFLDGCSDIRFFGGNISQKNGTKAFNFCVNNPTRVGFYGTSMYPDDGPAPQYVFEIPSGHHAYTVGMDQFATAQYQTDVYHGAHS